MKPQQELSIFKATSIDKLETLYYESKVYMTAKNKLLVETSFFVKIIMRFKKLSVSKSSKRH
jgi:hypothetical protein